MESMKNTYYDLLGVHKDATQEQIRSAYLELVARYHPDKHSDNPLQHLAEQKLVAINAAYENLCDPEHRGKYDATLDWHAERQRSSSTPISKAARKPISWKITLASLVILVLFVRPIAPILVRLFSTGLGLLIAFLLVCAFLVIVFFRWHKAMAKKNEKGTA